MHSSYQITIPWIISVPNVKGSLQNCVNNNPHNVDISLISQKMIISKLDTGLPLQSRGSVSYYFANTDETLSN